MDRRNALFGAIASLVAGICSPLRAKAREQAVLQPPGSEPTPRFKWRFIPSMEIEKNEAGDAATSIVRRREVILFELFEMPMKNSTRLFTGVVPVTIHCAPSHTAITSTFSVVNFVDRTEELLQTVIDEALCRFAVSAAEQAAVNRLIKFVTPDWTSQDCPSETNPKPLKQLVREWEWQEHGTPVLITDRMPKFSTRRAGSDQATVV